MYMCISTDNWCVYMPPLLQVKVMSSEDTEHKELFKRNLSHTNLAALIDQAEQETDQFTYDDGNQERQPLSPVAPKRLTGGTIKFHRVALDAPDGMPLVRCVCYVPVITSGQLHFESNSAIVHDVCWVAETLPRANGRLLSATPCSD